ncbi:hypothetical protein QVD17_03486 [Tagetes erecta]|uniref:CRABS CLAW n=1 Tax=Tagetes erecta TaxID=13708 RepID=A0AAD8L8F2_TARER|nr:hypothetical protein QVD17_03486 [Tagetes erecta]
MNFEVQAKRVVTNMDPQLQTPSDQHLCYVRCNFCNTLLAVGIPCKRLLDTVTVKCGHCSNLSFLTIRASHLDHPFQSPSLSPFQTAFSNDFKKVHSSSSSSTSNEPSSPKAHFVVKPPERKHRLPSAYNRFMKEEIQRIKASNPQIPHREAFSTAAKNWAGHIPNGSINGSINNNEGFFIFKVALQHTKKLHCFLHPPSQSTSSPHHLCSASDSTTASTIAAPLTPCCLRRRTADSSDALLPPPTPCLLRRHSSSAAAASLTLQIAELQTTSSVADTKSDEIRLQTFFVCKNKQHLNHLSILF